ncbi:MAG: TonB-dependent receptor [Chlorobi bacterium]|nr:TonB-dependent receptor [Chlorobiota bacterium]
MKNIFISALILLSFSALSQRPHNGMPGNMPKDGYVFGRVTGDNNNPIEYANIGLYRIKDSLLVTGTISDKHGWFSLANLAYGKYYVNVKFIGFNKYHSSDFMINPKQKSINLNDIVLTTKANQLGEVMVIEDKNPVEYKLDKKVVNVSQDLNSIGGTAVEVLENVPSVETDIDGNVSLRGSSDFLVLIDGKPSIFEGSDALQQIPSSTIDKIEIITNPSAKYDPDGVSGIINVITKKNVLKGLNGLVNISVGTRDKYSGDATLSYKTKKINIFGGVNYSNQTMYGTGDMSRITYIADTNYHLTSLSDRNMKRFRNSVKTGIDYYIDPNNTISFSGTFGQMGFGRNSLADYHDFTEPVVNDLFYISQNNFDINRNYIRLNIDYLKKFKEDGHQLDLSVYQSFNNGSNNELLEQSITSNDWNTIVSSMFQQKTFENNNGKELRAKADYERPTEKGKIETGYQFRYENNSQTYNLEQFDTTLNQWNGLSQFANDLDYSRYIQSLYFLYTGKSGIFEYKTGLRGEYTNRLIKQNKLNTEFPVKRLDWFPTLHVSLDLSDLNQLQVSYGRRIRRPRPWYLDPFVNYIDQQNIRVGNPSLEPENIDSYELNFMHKFGRSFVSVESYYRQTNNKINRTHTLGENNIMVHTFTNLDRDYSLGMEFMANLQINKWWRFNTTANYFKYKVEGNIEGVDLVQSTNTWSVRFNSTFKIKKSTKLQLTGYYSGPSVTVQGNREGFYFTNIGIKQDLWNRKANITLQVRDVFGTMKHSFISSGQNFYLSNEFNREPRVVTLQFSYIINNYKKAMKRGENGGMDFEMGNDM